MSPESPREHWAWGGNTLWEGHPSIAASLWSKKQTKKTVRRMVCDFSQGWRMVEQHHPHYPLIAPWSLVQSWVKCCMFSECGLLLGSPVFFFYLRRNTSVGGLTKISCPRCERVSKCVFAWALCMDWRPIQDVVLPSAQYSQDSLWIQRKHLVIIKLVQVAL